MQCHSHYLTKYEAIPGTKTGKLAASGILYFQAQHGLLYCSVSQSLRPQQGNKIHYDVSSELFIKKKKKNLSSTVSILPK